MTRWNWEQWGVMTLTTWRLMMGCSSIPIFILIHPSFPTFRTGSDIRLLPSNRVDRAI
uniref:Uncharacterized protein MANES_14G101400 n=1 Tax=Rhizophora mucronata TaxID=61149 RepID=A0A2P2IQB4_RHIMU